MSNEKYIVPSVDSALKILRFLSGYNHREATISEISTAIKVNRSTCYRIINTLQMNDFIEYNPNNKTYRLGIYMSILGSRAIEINDYLKVSQQYINEAMNVTGNTCVLTKRLDFNRFAYVLKSEPAGSFKVSVNVGATFPITAGSHGKCILAYGDRDIQSELISNHLVPFTPNTITDSERFRNELEEIRQRGYAISIDEHVSGVSGVAAPIIKPDSTVDMTISCIFITSSVEKETIHQWGKELHRIASGLSTKLYGSFIEDRG